MSEERQRQEAVRRRLPGEPPADIIEHLILQARERLVANPRARCGSLPIQWELRRVGVTNIPPARTIERVLNRAGATRRRGYVS